MTVTTDYAPGFAVLRVGGNCINDPAEERIDLRTIAYDPKHLRYLADKYRCVDAVDAHKLRQDQVGQPMHGYIQIPEDTLGDGTVSLIDITFEDRDEPERWNPPRNWNPPRRTATEAMMSTNPLPGQFIHIASQCCGELMLGAALAGFCPSKRGSVILVSASARVSPSSYHNLIYARVMVANSVKLMFPWPTGPDGIPDIKQVLEIIDA